MDTPAQKAPSVVDELLVEVEEAADEEVGEQNVDVAMELAERLEGAAAKLRASLKMVTAKELATLDEAREIMGKEFVGPEAVEKTWGRKLAPAEIPQIPFSIEVLQRARENGEWLKLDTDLTGAGKDMNMNGQSTHLKGRWAEEKKGKVLRDEAGWKRNEEFFTKDKPQLRWRLVGKEVIPGTLDENAVVQTRKIADHLQNTVFAGQEIPAEYAAAIAEFNAQEDEITKLMNSNWLECCRRLAALKLNQMCRRLPVEALSDCQTYFDNNGERLLENTYDRTTRLSSLGSLVLIGGADSAGASVRLWHPGAADPNVGVVLSRSR